MDIPVLLEPTPTGFRASTGAPLNLTAEAATADEATAELRRQFVVMQARGARVVPLTLPEPDPLFELAARLATNPFLDEWEAAVKECRRQREAEEEAAEAAKEAQEAASATGPSGPHDQNGHPLPAPTKPEPAA